MTREEARALVRLAAAHVETIAAKDDASLVVARLAFVMFTVKHEARAATVDAMVAHVIDAMGGELPS